MPLLDLRCSRHKSRQDLVLEFGATHIVSERGDAGVARITELTSGIGAESVLECVGTQESMTQAMNCARPVHIAPLFRAKHHRGRFRSFVIALCNFGILRELAFFRRDFDRLSHAKREAQYLFHRRP